MSRLQAFSRVMGRINWSEVRELKLALYLLITNLAQTRAKVYCWGSYFLLSAVLYKLEKLDKSDSDTIPKRENHPTRKTRAWLLQLVILKMCSLGAEHVRRNTHTHSATHQAERIITSLYFSCIRFTRSYVICKFKPYCYWYRYFFLMFKLKTVARA